MPVRNGERFLCEALESTLAQTVSGLEVIAVDDGSTDATPEILAETARRDPRLRVIGNTGAGITAALNAGFARAGAPLVARMDADDVMLPDRLERQLDLLSRSPDVAVVGGGVILTDEAGREIDRAPGSESPSLEAGNDLAHPTVVVRAEAFHEAGGYRLDGSEDYDLWLRIEERWRLAAVPEPVLRYRLHSGQFSVAKLEKHRRAMLAARAAADVRRRGEEDPLAGAEQIDDALLRMLGISQDEVDRRAVEDSVYWAAVLIRIGDRAGASTLLDAASRRPKAPARRALARRSRLLIAKRAARTGRMSEALRHTAAAVVGAEP